MARRAASKKGGLVKKVLIVGGTLIVVQVILILHFQQSTNPTTIREEISKQVDKAVGISAQRREALKIQLAINDFRLANSRLPNNLDELKPKYFDTIPIDPETGATFKYVVEGTKYTLGEKKTPEPNQPAGGPDVHNVSLAVDEQSALIATLDNPISETFVYDPTGKREPFRPFDMSPRVSNDPNKSPLERYDIGQLRLTAVIAGLDNPKATVENQTGKGYIVEKGTKIGLNGGEVVEILPDRIKILETTIEFTGEKRTNVVEMVLHPKGSEDNEGLRIKHR